MFNKIRYRCVFNRKGKLNRDGRSLVQVECLLNQRRVYFSTKVYLFPHQWDGNYVINHPLANELNKYLFEETINDVKKAFKVTPHDTGDETAP